MSQLFQDGWPVEAIFDKFDQEKQLSGMEALAYLAAGFSNATKNNYDAETLFQKITKDFEVVIKAKK